ncbi:TPA: hypothetical protein ACGCNR_003761, partial [Stenotrophomonas maltophilia]
MVVIATGDHHGGCDALRWNCLSKAWQRGDPDPRSMRVDRGFFCAAVSTKVDTHQSRTPFGQIAGI